jgi:hypothetical protein
MQISPVRFAGNTPVQQIRRVQPRQSAPVFGADNPPTSSKRKLGIWGAALLALGIAATPTAYHGIKTGELEAPWTVLTQPGSTEKALMQAENKAMSALLRQFTEAVNPTLTELNENLALFTNTPPEFKNLFRERMVLLAQHRENLNKLGITPESIAALGNKGPSPQQIEAVHDYVGTLQEASAILQYMLNIEAQEGDVPEEGGEPQLPEAILLILNKGNEKIAVILPDLNEAHAELLRAVANNGNQFNSKWGLAF